jgi:hypothetical protein
VNESEKKDRPSSRSEASKRRFRVERLEERVAPKGHFNPQSKWVGAGGGAGGSSITISSGTIY